MIYTISYIAIFLAEVLLSAFYFETKFERKSSKKILALLYTLSFVTLYSVRYLVEFLGASWPNLLGFLLCNAVTLGIGYKAKLKSCIFHPCMLLILMALTESIVMFSFSSILGINLLACLDNSINLIAQSIISKTLYAFSIYVISKISTKETGDKNALTTLLFILPVSSMVVIYSVLFSLSKYDVEQTYTSMLVMGFILLFAANIIVFWLYEFSLKTYKRNMELEIAQQKDVATAEYYELLNKQNESTKIVVHDIKRHLNTIKNLAPAGDKAISEYINNIIGEFGINNSIDYCNNPLVNVVTHRYKNLCDEADISFNIDIRNTSIDFMSAPDITAMLDNLLENAVEATSKANEKFIDFTITIKQKELLVISITNSVDRRVKILHNNIISSKKEQGVHGVGLKSIKRIVSKYNGEITMSFSEGDMTFNTTLVFQIPEKVN